MNSSIFMTISLVYMANPIYGGWVTFSAHLSLRYNCDLYKIKKRSESRKKRLWLWCLLLKKPNNRRCTSKRQYSNYRS